MEIPLYPLNLSENCILRRGPPWLKIRKTNGSRLTDWRRHLAQCRAKSHWIRRGTVTRQTIRLGSEKAASERQSWVASLHKTRSNPTIPTGIFTWRLPPTGQHSGRAFFSSAIILGSLEVGYTERFLQRVGGLV